MKAKTDHPPPRVGLRWRREQTSPESTSRLTAASEQERLITEALADLRTMDVNEVMTPRVDVTYLTIPVHEDDVAQAVRVSGHGAFPVVHDDLDDLVGVLFVNDLFRTQRRRSESGQTNSQASSSTLEISRRVRQPFVLPESCGVLEALSLMREKRRGFAVVVDEYGGVAGVLTIKDLLEPLVGQLNDEFDEVDDEPDIMRVDGLRWLIDGGSNIDQIEDLLKLEIPEGSYVTFAGYLLDCLGHIPEEGESIVLSGWELRVVEMEKRRIVKVLARHVTVEEPKSPVEEVGEAE